MRGSIIASYIDEEYKIRKAYENKKRQKCVVEGKKQFCRWCSIKIKEVKNECKSKH